ncbi:MAG TPA: kelch repeat-containing protein, partial [Ktedonobacteraceae bacterium]|nr:kelch repeat-containing protein [Ktedonobacteraceae bacterium]
MFKQWFFPSNDRTRRRLLIASGPLMVLTLVSLVLLSVSPHLTQAAPTRPSVTSGNWTQISSMHIARTQYAATRLANGRVLVVGGYDVNGNPTATAELYDPATGSWTLTGSLPAALIDHTATLLADGRVLVAGGFLDRAKTTAELYDPATGTWTLTGSLHEARRLHTATLLA